MGAGREVGVRGGALLRWGGWGGGREAATGMNFSIISSDLT